MGLGAVVSPRPALWRPPRCYGIKMTIAHPAKRSTTYFNCPNCGALYHLVKAKAGVETIDREIKCLSCNARLPSREGDLVLKYFLLKKPTLPDLRARKEVSERPPTPSLAPRRCPGRPANTSITADAPAVNPGATRRSLHGYGKEHQRNYGSDPFEQHIRDGQPLRGGARADTMQSWWPFRCSALLVIQPLCLIQLPKWNVVISPEFLKLRRECTGRKECRKSMSITKGRRITMSKPPNIIAKLQNITNRERTKKLHTTQRWLTGTTCMRQNIRNMHRSFTQKNTEAN
jgi:predicted Zn finger-like uncharacterized protein